MRAGIAAVAATDAFGTVGCLPDWDIQLADMLACAALGAFVSVDLKAVERDRVEQSVNHAKWAQIAAERPIDDDAEHQQYGEDGGFPSEQPAERSA